MNKYGFIGARSSLSITWDLLGVLQSAEFRPFGYLGIPLPLIETIEAKDCTFESLTEKIDTSGPMGRAMLTIMSAFAQLERDQLRERTMAGLAEARKNDRLGGRPRKADDQDIEDARKWKAEGVNVDRIAKRLSVSRATVYRYLNTDDDPQLESKQYESVTS